MIGQSVKRMVGKVAPLSSSPPTFENTPDYMQPFVQDDDHPLKQGTVSPYLDEDTARSQKAVVETFDYPGALAPANKLQPHPKAREMGEPAKVDDTDETNSMTSQPLGGQELTWQHHMQVQINVMQLLRSALVELKKAHPQLRANIVGQAIGGKQNAFSDTQAGRFSFTVNGKKVPALRLLIQNNTASTIYLDMDKDATAGSIAIGAGGFFNEEVTCEYVSFLNSAAGVTQQVNQQQSGSVVLQAWSNPEWANAWGQI